MFKKIGFILALLSFGLSSAQIKFGVNAGATYSNFRGNSFAESFKRDLGFLAGISAEYYIKEHLSIIANLSYERKSAKDEARIEIRENFDDPPMVYDVKFKMHYDYITLPIVAKYEFGKNYDFFVSGGLFVGYLLKSKNTNDIPVDGLGNDDITTDLNKKIDGGLVIGIGKIVKLNDKNELRIEIRDNIGLINTSDVSVVDNGSIKTNALNLIVGWSFDYK